MCLNLLDAGSGFSDAKGMKIMVKPTEMPQDQSRALFLLLVGHFKLFEYARHFSRQFASPWAASAALVHLSQDIGYNAPSSPIVKKLATALLALGEILWPPSTQDREALFALDHLHAHVGSDRRGRYHTEAVSCHHPTAIHKGYGRRLETTA